MNLLTLRVSCLFIFLEVFLGGHEIRKIVVDNEAVLDNLRNCETGWSYDNQTVKGGFKMQVKKSGFYQCANPFFVLFLLPIAKEMYFHFSIGTTFNNDHAFEGEVIKLFCGISFYAGVDTVKTELILYDASNVKITSKEDFVENKSYSIEFGPERVINETGILAYSCVWKLTTYFGETMMSSYEQKLVAIPVGKVPSNVRPSHSQPAPNETVSCLADSSPPVSEHKWTCIPSSDWSTTGQFIIFKNEGEFNCTCNVVSFFKESIFRKFWNGIIQVTIKKSTTIETTTIEATTKEAITFKTITFKTTAIATALKQTNKEIKATKAPRVASAVNTAIEAVVSNGPDEKKLSAMMGTFLVGLASYLEVS